LVAVYPRVGVGEASIWFGMRRLLGQKVGSHLEYHYPPWVC